MPNFIGVDEVGRGAWAGPLLVVAASPIGQLPAGIKDSKLLSKKHRQKFALELIEVCQFGEGWVSAQEIDSVGLSEALRLGARRALQQLQAKPDDQIIVDGRFNFIDAKYFNVKCLIKADNLIPIVSSASIYAKVKRDEFMANLAQQFPNYGFAEHVGYGTKLHQQQLAQQKPLPNVHRLSFKPVAAWL